MLTACPPRGRRGVLSGGTIVRKSIVSRSLRLLAAMAAVCISVLTLAQTQPQKTASYKEKVLHAFNGTSDGWVPTSLVRDAKGNLYGTNADGGYLGGGCDSFFAGCGTVFELSAGGKFKLLHTFKYSDGAIPFGNLIQDASGNLYGTTVDGGNNGECESGCGVVFKVSPTGKFTMLYNFTAGSDGANSTSGVIMDAARNLYGVAQTFGAGEVFELTTSGDFRVLYSFNGTADGGFPNGVVQDSRGNLYGTTVAGGDMSRRLYQYGCGVVYKLDTNGTETVLYSFKGGSDGAFPEAPLFMDKGGNLYGTTTRGGDEKKNCDRTNEPLGCGTIFEIDTAGTFSVLFTFDSADGYGPNQLMQDAHGNLYGTTPSGGNGRRSYGGEAVGCGVVFKLTPSGKESVLHNFRGQRDGGDPSGGVVEDTKGNLYGTTLNGGDLSCAPGTGVGCGVIFELTP
jgi:uncharacterized repeat protein (TIGR03803 family)